MYECPSLISILSGGMLCNVQPSVPFLWGLICQHRFEGISNELMIVVTGRGWCDLITHIFALWMWSQEQLHGFLSFGTNFDFSSKMNWSCWSAGIRRSKVKMFLVSWTWHLKSGWLRLTTVGLGSYSLLHFNRKWLNFDIHKWWIKWLTGWYKFSLLYNTLMNIYINEYIYSLVYCNSDVLTEKILGTAHMQTATPKSWKYFSLLYFMRRSREQVQVTHIRFVIIFLKVETVSRHILAQCQGQEDHS